MKLNGTNEISFSPNCLSINKSERGISVFVAGCRKIQDIIKYRINSEESYLRIYDQYCLEKYFAVDMPHSIEFISTSPDQKVVLVGGRCGLLKIDGVSLVAELISEDVEDSIDSASFINESSKALILTGSGAIWKIDVESNTAIPLLNASEESGKIITHPDGNQFVLIETSDGHTFLTCYLLEQLQKKKELLFSAEFSSSLSFNHTGDLFAFTLDHLYLFHYPSLEPVLRIEKSGKINEDFSMENLGESEVWTDIIFSQDDRFLYFGNNVGGEIIRVDLINKSSEVLVKTHKDAIRKIAMSVDDSIMAAIGIDSTLRVWRMETD